MKALLLCYGGFSTGIMKMKIEQAAKADGADLEVSAKALDALEEYAEDFDLFLLGPQVRYAEDDVKEQVGDKPVLVISTQDFGMMNGEAVWNQIKDLNK